MTTYSPTSWADGVTDITAVLLNNADLGIYNAHDEIAAFTYTGMIMAWPLTTGIPTGWFECNGQAISRVTYSVLYAMVGTRYGAGDGVNTFNVPDFRGAFIRGLDESRGYDSNRALDGNLQSSDVKAHTDHYYHEDTYNTNTYAVDGSGAQNYPGLESPSTSNQTGTDTLESRPKNKAVVFCIRA